MDGTAWVIVATLLGPILAVQAQKAVERIREHRGRKAWVFHRLMATRAARVSAEHVQALNMIDLAFYGTRVFGVHRRTKTEQAVIDSWREYLDHLNTKWDGPETLPQWQAKGNELFVNLLYAITLDVGFRFDRVQLNKGAYSPIAHGDLELELNLIRRLALRVLAGDQAIKMSVTSLPVDEAAAKLQDELRGKLTAVLDGESTVKVRIEQPDA